MHTGHVEVEEKKCGWWMVSLTPRYGGLASSGVRRTGVMTASVPIRRQSDTHKSMGALARTYCHVENVASTRHIHLHHPSTRQRQWPPTLRQW